jgi:hypothetical protein
MDERSEAGPRDDLPDEYSDLGNPRLVIEEVVRLLDELHRASTRLGDAIVSGGLPAREWRSRQARLDQISDEFPPITLDELLTRLAEFSAGTAILWLHGGPAELDRFQDETIVLNGVVTPLRSFAQRQRMLPARERGGDPLWKALGDPLVGTPLDLVAKGLRDLDALAPFLAPISAEDWKAIDAARAQAAPPPKAAPKAAKSQAEPPPQQPAPFSPPAPAKPPTVASVAPPMPVPAPPPVGSLTVEDRKPMGEPSATPPKRLREYLPSAPAVLPRGAESRLSRSLQASGRYLLQRWAVVLTVIVMLALAIGLITVIGQGRAKPTADAHLVAAPTSLTLSCAGKANAITFTLKNTGARAEAWKATPPKGLTLSALTGTLAPNASATLKLTVTPGSKASSGALTITDADGVLSIPYRVTC